MSPSCWVAPCQPAHRLPARSRPFSLRTRSNGRLRYELTCYSPDGRPLANGPLALGVGGRFGDAIACDLLVVAADALLPFNGHALFTTQLARHASRGIPVAGVRGGLWWLARARLLDGRRAAGTPARTPPSSPSAIPRSCFSNRLYEQDGERLSASCPAAAMDLFTTLCGQRHGIDFAAAVAERLSLERIRRADELQRVPHTLRIGATQPRLAEALQLMEANVEEPLSTEEIAELVGISRRQLERLFRQHLDTLPSRHYLELRLARARDFLRRTSRSIVQIGLACGFSSGPHFSTAYRARYGITPREERARSAGFGSAEPGIGRGRTSMSQS
jgi:Transcriptional regulator containing an amidase domain and an AraC-type DNA-binding HTH domain